MRKLNKFIFVFGGGISAALIYAWPYIKMEFAGSAHYTEKDIREYDFYTPDILKKMPRITDKYDFDFANVTGPASHVYAVKFYGTEDISKIESYLESIGYKRHTCDFESECWRDTDPSESVYVGTLKNENTVIVQVVYSFT